MSITTRKPTGAPPWPILLLAGVEKAGKSYAAAAASGSDLVGRTLWVTVGEDEPDELGAVPGARFEIVEHDGTYRGILATVQACGAELARDEMPGLIILDSGTRLWNLLTDEAQAEANRRAAAKAARYGKAAPADDVAIGMDLWNRAKGRWEAVIHALRVHRGPSIITARLEQTAVVGPKGEPTGEKTWKIQAHKSLPWDVGGIVKMPAPRQAYVTGVRSLRAAVAADEERPFADFTVDKLWRAMGLDEDVASRRHTHLDGEASLAADGGLEGGVAGLKAAMRGPDAGPPAMTDAQRRALFAAFTAAGITERAEQLEVIGTVLKRDVGTRADLSRDEAASVIDAVTRSAGQDGATS